MRRIIFYLFHDSQGVVDDYIPHKLTALREHAAHIFVVSNCALDADARARLESVADTVWERENVGFDVWAYKEAMEHYGMDNLAEYDELVLMNYTFFAPIFPFSELFERMDAQELDFWGPTAHKEVSPHPFPGYTGTMPLHIQSHWISVRKQMFTSHEFREYWSTMPMITSYEGSIVNHESRFTKHFSDKGFTYAVSFPPEDYTVDHPVFQSAQQMLDDRCPLLKRRMFFHEPSYLDKEAIIGRKIIEKVERESDYPVELILSNVVRTSEPRNVYTNLSMLEVVNEVEIGEPLESPLKIAALVHIYYDDMVDELMGYLNRIAQPYDLIITTDTEGKKRSIADQLAKHGRTDADIRVVASNRGRDMAAMFIECRDVTLSDEYDVVLRLHSKKSPQNSANAASMFKDHMFDNLAFSEGYVANVLKMFAREKTLGMAFPPVVHIGFPTLGHSWFTNRYGATLWAQSLGIKAMFDRATPIAPYGGMFWFRPKALRKLFAHEWKYEMYPDDGEYGDGGLPHIQERLFAYTAFDAGYHVKSIINREQMSINYTFLEYKLQRISSMLPAYTEDQVAYISELQRSAPIIQQVKDEVKAKFPKLAKVAVPSYKAARKVYRAGRSLRER